ncbi:craniofacial development protein 1-like [Acanthaster planci]|uniref:Craniofacial development protein 1 n=1 Tax=Acanthaster planci TaxID=133434 RepID=A0A8B7YZG2_ACAPL|nr:craniofacial development protein 1-like [Acanthaster planci]
MLCEPEDEDYSSDEDEDYLPSGEASEGESDDDETEDDGRKDGEVVEQQRSKVKKAGKKRKRQKVPEIKRVRTGGIQLPEAEEKAGTKEPTQDAEDAAASVYKEELRAAQLRKEEKEKQKAKELWSSFLKDVGQKPKARPQPSSHDSTDSLGATAKQVSLGTHGSETKPETNDAAERKTVTITKVFDFAGEEVKVTEEVAADSKEAKNLSQSAPSGGDRMVASDGASRSTPSIPKTGPKRPAGGLSSVLGLINKKPKMSVLEKSRLDWNSFTRTEGIADELKLHNKGKEGYIEKQKFLAQADQRQYEKERDLRMGLAKR